MRDLTEFLLSWCPRLNLQAFFFFFKVLGIEPRALGMLALCHAPNPFCFYVLFLR
jgi:hypothetical protein